METGRARGSSGSFHVPVLVDEAMGFLQPRDDEVVVDATVGGGGHARYLLDALGPGGRVVGVDRDAEALDAARRALDDPRLTLVHSDFRSMTSVIEAQGLDGVDGLVADLGVSSHQLDEAGRGFAFSSDGPLDMRMDRSAKGPPASTLVARMTEADLAALFKELGEEPRARAAARAIVRARKREPIRTTTRLAEVLASALSGGRRRQRRHPATRCFQALRIAVNRELDALDALIESLPRVLGPGGRCVVISYHSLEDRRVKQGFRRLAGACRCPPRLPECRCGAESLGRVLTPRVVRPSRGEIENNPRARSARLRAFRRAA